MRRLMQWFVGSTLACAAVGCGFTTGVCDCVPHGCGTGAGCSSCGGCGAVVAAPAAPAPAPIAPPKELPKADK